MKLIAPPALSGMFSVVFALLAAGQPGRQHAGQFDLLTDAVTDSTDPWPAICGLPFPTGAITDPARIRVMRDGTVIPAQIDVVSAWPDGSIRWAQAGFMAEPGAGFQVQFGESAPPAAAPSQALVATEGEDGTLTVDTGAAVYVFRPGQLLPDQAKVGAHVFLDGAGDGAYLVDNRGRLARVAGPAAAVQSRILRQGPQRMVLMREGWYVTETNERIARAQAWFYLSAGFAGMRMTHSLILTEDTNDVWVRDYGLALTTPQAPRRATFALEAADRGFSPRPRSTDARWLDVAPTADSEVYLYQDTFPHFRENETLAVVGEGADPRLETLTGEAWQASTFWLENWADTADAAGDWGHADYGDYALTVVMPHLAQRFPKEIAIAPSSVRLAFWSARGGRELDFRMPALINDYWQDWVELYPGGPEALSDMPSNAQGMARTHDVWLLPGPGGASPDATARRARTAAYPPKLLADPAWSSASGAFDWPVSPRDEVNEADVEALVDAFWEGFMNSRHGREPYIGGFIEWGRNPTMRGLQFFRLHSATYNLPLHIWGAYLRSGNRSMLHYGARYNQFVSDVRMTHWDAGRKFKGGRAQVDFMNPSQAPPLYWGDVSTLDPFVVISMHAFLNEYYLTGNERMRHVAESYGEAYRTHWDPEALPSLITRSDFGFHHVRELVALYRLTGDEAYARMARDWVESLVDLDVPNAINDALRFGSLYKVDRNILWLCLYYEATGHELAREAALQALDYKYRFSRLRLAGGSQDYAGVLYAIAYRWTGDARYLRVLDYQRRVGLARQRMRESPATGILDNRFPTINLPGLMTVLSTVATPIETFPVLHRYHRPESSRILFRQGEGTPPATFKATVWMEAPTLKPKASIIPKDAEAALAGVKTLAEPSFMTSYAGRQAPHWYSLEVELPASVTPGLYFLDIPGAAQIRMLETSVDEIAIYAPEGIQLQADGQPNYFPVDASLDELEVFLGIAMEIRRPDGTLALEASAENLGHQRIAVSGNGGAWRVATDESGGAIRLLNTAPIFARCPEWLVRDAGLEPAPRFKAPGVQPGFVEGLDGQALHLPGAARVAFDRGDRTGERYAHFPGATGTIEFWFRPNWTSLELPYTVGRRFNDQYFLRAGSHDLQYRRGQRRRGGPELTSMNLWLRGEHDVESGFSGGHLFRAGEWYHVAATWQFDAGEPGNEGQYAVFINGQAVAPTAFRSPSPYWPGGWSDDAPLILREPHARVSIGPINGTIAQFRISETVRYASPFTPPARFEGADAQTLAWFSFDGSLQGESSGGEALQATVVD